MTPHHLDRAMVSAWPGVRRTGEIAHLLALTNISRVALSSSSIDEVMDLALHALMRNLDVDYAKVLQVQKDRPGLKLQWGIGWDQGYLGEAIVPPGIGSQAGFTLAQRHPVVVKDFEHEMRFTAPGLLVKHDVKSGISSTMYGDSQPVGVVAVHLRKPRCFTRPEAVFVHCVGTILSAAIRDREAPPRTAILPGSLPEVSATPRTSGPRVLKGWKEIAEYLGVGVRTAERWEETVSLPVRRPAGKLKSSVIASSADLDAWVARMPTRLTHRSTQQAGQQIAETP